MSEHSHCTYPERAVHEEVVIAENVQVACDTYRVRFRTPGIARQIVPGQFVMLRLQGTNDPLLGRPLAVYDVVNDAAGQPESLDVVYLAVGRMTKRLAGLPAGTALDVWGPLGNGFPAAPTEHLLMVAGGIGQTPFLTLAKEYLGLTRYGDPPRSVDRAQKVTLCYGARNAKYLAGLDDFQRAGVEIWLSTDDGSQGRRGLVTDLARPLIEESAWPTRIVCCGPEPMLKAVAAIAAEKGAPCQVSLETPMACGIGICFSCVVRIRDAQGNWDYRRTCVEGPVFDAAMVEF